MSLKINKNDKEYPLGFVPQSLYDDVEELKATRPLVRYSKTLSVIGAGTGTIISDSEVFDTPFPNECIAVMVSVRRNANDTSVFAGEVRVKLFDKNSFGYAFIGNNGNVYYIDYIAFGY